MAEVAIADVAHTYSTLAGEDLTLLPDPAPRPVWCPIISVDDHVLEPATLFDRVPSRLRDQAPQLVEVDGRPAWRIGGDLHFLSGTEGAVGRPADQTRRIGLRFDQFRSGVYDADARIKDMDLAGVWASLCFPSTTWGFAGRVFSKLPDREVALACVRAYNDWVVEDWCASHPDRLIPCQVPFLADPKVAAEEIRRNAARGVHAVTFSENPAGLGFPSLHSDYWDPFLAACEETETVINLHVGSSGTVMRPAPDSPDQAIVALFPMSGISAVVDWVFSRIPIRFPGLQIVTSEAGASWVPTVLERLDRAYQRRGESDTWSASDPHPAELVAQNFWFASIEDPSAFRLLDIIGEDRVMVETDYPHADSSWPDNQVVLERDLRHLPTAVVRKICFENAAALYRHPLPPDEMLARSVLLGDVSPAAGAPRVVIPDGQVDDLVPPIQSNTRYLETTNLTFSVEFRELNARVIRETYKDNPAALAFLEPMMGIDDVGVTIHVYSKADMLERVRFDAFGDKAHAHYHYVFPDGSHRKMDYDAAACGDFLTWALGGLPERLPEMLRVAGADELAARVEPDEVRAVVDQLAAMAAEMLGDRAGSAG